MTAAIAAGLRSTRIRWLRSPLWSAAGCRPGASRSRDSFPVRARVVPSVSRPLPPSFARPFSMRLPIGPRGPSTIWGRLAVAHRQVALARQLAGDQVLPWDAGRGSRAPGRAAAGRRVRDRVGRPFFRVARPAKMPRSGRQIYLGDGPVRSSTRPTRSLPKETRRRGRWRRSHVCVRSSASARATEE